MSPSVRIVMSCYNGVKFLPHQLESILGQTHSDFSLVIRDDGSKDGTVEVIREYQARDKRITMIEDDLGNQGASGSFSLLLSRSDAELTFLSDQDDEWLPEKLSIFLERYRSCDPSVPTVLYSDLEIVNGELQTISPSMFSFQHLRPYDGKIGNLLVQNAVTGCASAVNASLRRVLGPIPHQAIMHDWWYAIVAAATGDLVYIDRPTVRYRQHGKNVFGAKSYSVSGVDWKNELGRMKGSIRDTIRQAEALSELNYLTSSERDIIKLWGRFDRLPMYCRPYYMLKHGYLKSGLFRNLIFAPLTTFLRHEP